MKKIQWKTLQHRGILIPAAFETKGIKIRIKGRPVALDLGQEEMVYQWAKKKDTPYAKDGVFQKNFTADFAKTFGPKFKNLSYNDIDFSVAYKLVDKEKDKRDMMSKEARKKQARDRKEMREKLKAQYGVAVMDGKDVDVGNYMAEPPGIFIGRGKHPLRGRWKPRVTQRDITLNLGSDAKVPGGNWAKIIHDGESTWLASWVDYLTRKRKYVWLADSAGLKQDRDKAKYEKAVKLAKGIDKVKRSIVRDMKSRNPATSRIATVCYLINRTAMRVGDEKDADEADTVGATTLRKEHIIIKKDTIEFDFLGKDSVRWQEKLVIKDDDVQFRTNLKRLVEKKKPKDDIFEDITSRHVNRYYSGIVKGLTAKVFRTYLATATVAEYLSKYDKIHKEAPHKKLYRAKMANLQAATMCNHKRTIPKTFEQSLQKKRDRLKILEGETTPTQKTLDSLKKAESVKPKTPVQKNNKKKRITKLHEQIEMQKQRHETRKEKLSLQISLTEQTKDFNLGTSLRNYIDPRVFKAWTDEVGAEWEKLYTSALQKKFLWVKGERTRWRDQRKSQA